MESVSAELQTIIYLARLNKNHFRNERKEHASPCSGRPEPSDRCRRTVQRSAEIHPREKSSDIAAAISVSHRTSVWYHHIISYHGRFARRKPLHHVFKSLNI